MADPYRQHAEAVAKQYTHSSHLRKELGSGAEGFVFPTEQATAIKVFRTQEKFRAELAAYARLHHKAVTDILGFAVPRLVKYHSKLMVIETDGHRNVHCPAAVSPRFCPSPARYPFEFETGQEEEWWEQKRLEFGPDFETAQDVFYALIRTAGIYYYDLAPRNMRFRN